jgi:hypothetical protein
MTRDLEDNAEQFLGFGVDAVTVDAQRPDGCDSLATDLPRRGPSSQYP